jgi:hypothetical protein
MRTLKYWIVIKISYIPTKIVKRSEKTQSTEMRTCKITKGCEGKTKCTNTLDLKKEYGDKYFGIDRTNTCDTCGKSYIVRTTI